MLCFVPEKGGAHDFPQRLVTRQSAQREIEHHRGDKKHQMSVRPPGNGVKAHCHAEQFREDEEAHQNPNRVAAQSQFYGMRRPGQRQPEGPQYGCSGELGERGQKYRL